MDNARMWSMRGVKAMLVFLVATTTAACGSANRADHPRPTHAHARPPSPTPASPVPEPPIAFTSLNGEFWTIETVDAGGGDVQHLVDIAPAGARMWADPLDALGQADWSPDRTRLAFICVTNASSICVSAADGSDAIVLRLPGRLVAAADPSWSPDGTQIAFAGVTSTSPIRAQIDVMNADGSNLHRLTSGSKGSVDPTWSPDGTHIAYQSLDDDIWIMNADGTGAHALRVTTAHEIEPAWSPDGRHIAFSVVSGQMAGATPSPGATSGPGNQSGIFVMNADGTIPIELTPSDTLGVWPTWSPDGREIAYMCGRLIQSDICVMNADGTDQHRLVGGPTLDMHPAWS
jgi:Tol biopolymer transport system component